MGNDKGYKWPADAGPITDGKGVIIYQTDGSFGLDVRLEDDTVWLSQAQMAELFQTSVPNINMHIKNVFDEGELEQTSTSKDFLIVRNEGGRTVERKVAFYDLDVIISVGYRVKSKRGTQFRQWANRVLKDHILKEYAVHQRFERIEQRVGATEKKIDFFIMTSLPPVQDIFFEGQIFDAYVFVSDLIMSAKKTIILMDNYVDHTVLTILSKRLPKVTAEIYTKRISPQLRLDLEKHNAQYEPVTILESDRFHDRFLIIDGTVYLIGSSLKDLGKKLFAFSRMEIAGAELIKGL
jgi:hypothetical protein